MELTAMLPQLPVLELLSVVMEPLPQLEPTLHTAMLPADNMLPTPLELSTLPRERLRLNQRLMLMLSMEPMEDGLGYSRSIVSSYAAPAIAAPAVASYAAPVISRPAVASYAAPVISRPAIAAPAVASYAAPAIATGYAGIARPAISSYASYGY